MGVDECVFPWGSFDCVPIKGNIDNISLFRRVLNLYSTSLLDDK